MPLSRWFLRIIQSLQHKPMLAWIEESDLTSPVWSIFLTMARQGTLKLPLAFLFPLSTGAQTPQGTVPLVLPNSETQTSTSQRGPFGDPLPTRLAQYVGRMLPFGPTFRPKALKKVSRAKHMQRLAELRQRGILDDSNQLQPGTLRGARIIYPTLSVAWRQRAIALLTQQRDTPSSTKDWFRLAHTPTIEPASITPAVLSRAFLTLGTSALPGPTPETKEHWVEATRHTAILTLQREPNIPHLAWQSDKWNEPFATLIEASEATPPPAERNTRPTQWLQTLASGPYQAYAIVALRIAQWHLGFGRMQQAFQLLSTIRKQRPQDAAADWSLSWWEAYVTTEAYARMGRMDLSRHTLERGIAALPKPISPVLSGEIRLATVFLQWLEHHRLDTDALQEARRQFRTMGAGRRLGHVLMWEGETAWYKANWEEARQLYAQALTLFKQYRDGFRLHEAQLKLGLILKEKPLATLYPPVQ